MELALIVLIVIIAVALIVFIVVYNRKKNEELKYYSAAGNILREDFLDYSLQNHMINGQIGKEPRGRKMMIYIKTKGNKNGRYVFDPEKKVNIGRDKHNGNIYINDNSVSQKHCCIYSQDDYIYLKDCNSANGTVLLRGWLGKYSISGGSKVLLKSGDRIGVGPCVFKVKLFYYDMSLM